MQVESAGSIDTSTHVCIKEEDRKAVCVISYMHTMSDKIETAVEPVVATAPTAAEQRAARAAFDRAEEVRFYQAGLRAAAENKANRERESAYWRGDY